MIVIISKPKKSLSTTLFVLLDVRECLADPKSRNPFLSWIRLLEAAPSTSLVSMVSKVSTADGQHEAKAEKRTQGPKQK